MTQIPSLGMLTSHLGNVLVDFYQTQQIMILQPFPFAIKRFSIDFRPCEYDQDVHCVHSRFACCDNNKVSSDQIISNRPY